MNKISLNHVWDGVCGCHLVVGASLYDERFLGTAFGVFCRVLIYAWVIWLVLVIPLSGLWWMAKVHLRIGHIMTVV